MKKKNRERRKKKKTRKRFQCLARKLASSSKAIVPSTKL